MDTPAQRPHRVLGGVDVAVALLLLAGVWLALPARWWPVDLVGTAVALALAGTGVGLLRGERWSERVGRIVGMVILGVGMVLVTALAITASHVSGLYGPIGGGGAVLLLVIALLVLPYLVILPALHVWALSR